jgi:hypothetical protein
MYGDEKPVAHTSVDSSRCKYVLCNRDRKGGQLDNVKP